MGKFFEKKSYVQLIRPAAHIIKKTIVKNPKKAAIGTGIIAADVAEAGGWAKNTLGIETEPNLIDDWFLLGFPGTAILGDAMYKGFKSGTISPGETYIDAAGKKRTRPYCDNWPGGCAAEEKRLRQKASHGKGVNEVRPLEEHEIPK